MNNTLIKLENISKSYANNPDRKVLDGIDFTIETNDSIAIIGPSGSGKSTLLNIMGTLDNADDGKVYFDTNEISLLQAEQIIELRNQQIGFIFQQHHLLPQLNVLENVMVPTLEEKDKNKKEEAKRNALTLLEKVGMRDKINQLPAQLSVGECQRAAVVRALINNPSVLLADEPTGSLDENTALSLMELLLEIQQEQHITIIMVTHDTSLAKKLNTVYRLNNGKLTKIHPE